MPTVAQKLADLQAEAAALQLASYHARALANAYEEPKGQAMLKQRLATLKYIAIEEERASRAKRRAEVGGLSEGMEHGAKKLAEWKTSLDEIGNKAAITFAGLTASITGFVAASSPAHFATLSGSFKLLAGAVGEAFLPSIEDASRWIQKAAAWVRDLDDGTKGVIVKTALWVVGLVGLLAVGAKVGALLLATGARLLWLGGILKTIALAAWANPLIAGMVALGAAIGVVAGAFGSMKDKAREAGQEVEGVNKTEIKEKSDVGKRRTLSDEDRAEIRKAMEKGANLEETYKKIRQKYEAEIKLLEDDKNKGGGAKRSQETSELLEDFKGGNNNPFKALKKLGEIYGEDLGAHKYGMMKPGMNPANQLEYLKKLAAELEDRHGGGDLGKARSRKQALDELIKGASGESGLLTSMGGLSPRPGFHTGAGYGESLQLRSLEGEAEGPLGTKIFVDQMQALMKLLGDEGFLKNIADNTDDIKRKAPAWRT